MTRHLTLMIHVGHLKLNHESFNFSPQNINSDFVIVVGLCDCSTRKHYSL